MSELYPGQASVIATKLQAAEHHLASSQERLSAETDPGKRANLHSLIAGQSGTVGSYRRALQKSQSETDETRSGVLKIRLSPAERARLEANASAAGQTLAQFIRQACGL